VPTLRVALKTDVVVIGAGQAGLSSAYHLKKRGLAPGKGFVVLDQSVGYGPSASTIGANRAGAAAARELMAFLGKW
jgi:cation diffusion facilitator CzcD-associated flavoprotein CzcO